MLAALLLQTSVFVDPLYLDDEPPELRSVQHVVLLHADVPGVDPRVTATRAEALAAAAVVHAELEGGADFEAVARRVSHARSLELGSFAPGMLPPEMDAFLFSADVGDVSAPLDTHAGVQLLRRVETWAACLAITIGGDDERAQERTAEVARRLEAGEDFAALARAFSDDRESAEDGGLWRVFQRGPDDRLLKAAAFDLDVGGWAGPIRSPLGSHFVQRVEPRGFPAELWDRQCIRLRALLVGWRGGVPGDDTIARDPAAALAIAEDVSARLAEGADFAELARAIDDDPGGRERAGDLGWVHRFHPGLPPALDALFTRPVGWTSPPLRTSAGFAILRRER